MIKEVVKQYKKYRNEYINNLKNEKNKIKRIKLQIPNILTRSRILAPFILVPCTIVGNFALATIIIALLGLTDCLDGFLARKWNATSNYGQKLDAVSDKLFAIGIASPILITNPLLILPTILLETIIGSINFKSQIKGNNPKSTLLGKFKTTVLYVFLASIYLTKALNIPLSLFTLTCGTNILQLGTAVQYYIIDKKKESNKKEEEKEENTKTEEKSQDDLSISHYRKQIEELKNLKESLTLNNVDEKEKTYIKTPKK